MNTWTATRDPALATQPADPRQLIRLVGRTDLPATRRPFKADLQHLYSVSHPGSHWLGNGHASHKTQKLRLRVPDVSGPGSSGVWSSIQELREQTFLIACAVSAATRRRDA